MFKRLRISFVLLVLAAAAFVMAAAIALICYLDYRGDVDDVQGRLTDLTLQALGTMAYSDDTFASDTDREEYPVAVYLLSRTSEDEADMFPVEALSTAGLYGDTFSSVAKLMQVVPDGFAELEDQGLFYVRTTQGVSTAVAFQDNSVVSHWKILARRLGIIGAGVLVFLFLLSLIFSALSLKPVKNAWDREHRFIADVSHDLKTPVAVILANNAILEDNPQATIDEMGQWVDNTKAEALAMQSMVNDLVELYRLDEADGRSRKEISAALAPFNFSQVVARQSLLFESLAFERGLTLESDDLTPNLSVTGDSASCTRLVACLLDNACKYTPAGGGIRVCLKRSNDGRSAVCSVNNDAVIPAKDLPHIFERFYRADVARNLNTSSHGLGLSIAQGIAKAHGGTLTVASDEAHGTTFTITLPLS